MHPFDSSLILTYGIILIGMGVYLSRRAARSSEHYFLAGRSTPWWALGASGMSSNLDVAGTMTIVTMIYLFGAHGFFIEMRGGVVLPIAVFLAFMGKWHRRSGVMTTAEWMALRFGSGKDALWARGLAAGTYLLISVCMVVFFLTAAGTFLAVFLPLSPVQCMVLMAMIGLLYTLLSGLYGVIWTDVFQAGVIAFAALYVGWVGWSLVRPELITDWPGAAFNQALPRVFDPELGEYSLFIFFLVAFAAKGLVEGLGGSGGSAYMAQRFYAASSDRDCQKLSMLWTLLFAFRWPMAVGFAILAVHLGIETTGDGVERILPVALQSEFFPVGIRGLVVVAIFAASMSTFDSTVNAGASYFVRDLYQPITGRTGDRSGVWIGYLASVLIVGLGLILALTLAEGVLQVWVTIVVQLFPAFLVPFALRWFWGRFNATGFNLGIVFGFIASAASIFHPAGAFLNEASTIFSVSLVSLLGCFLGVYLGPPTPESTRQAFFEKVRPFGLWPRPWKDNYRDEHRRDLIRLPVAVLWQVTSFLTPILVVLHNYPSAAATAILWILCTIILLRDLRRPDPEDQPVKPPARS